jgi:hypothetical protein
MKIRTILLVSVLLSVPFFVGGCYFQMQAEKKANARFVEQVVEVEAKAAETRSVQHEKDLTVLEYDYRLSELGNQMSALNVRHGAEREQLRAEIESGAKLDAAFLGIGGILLGGVPGAGGILALAGSARKKYRAGETVTAQTFRDVIAVAREADPAFNAAFDGKAGEILKSQLPEHIVTIIKASGKNKPLSARIGGTA